MVKIGAKRIPAIEYEKEKKKPWTSFKQLNNIHLGFILYTQVQRINPNLSGP